MTVPVRIGREAEAEMAEAARRYDAARPGLGAEFLDAVDRVVLGIAAWPRAGSPVPGVADRALRRRAVRRFPYHLVYLELPERVQVVAVAHDRRRPGYWMERVAP